MHNPNLALTLGLTLALTLTLPLALTLPSHLLDGAAQRGALD